MSQFFSLYFFNWMMKFHSLCLIYNKKSQESVHMQWFILHAGEGTNKDFSLLTLKKQFLYFY